MTDMRVLYKVLKLEQHHLKRYLKKVLKQNGYSPVIRDGYIYAEGTEPVGLVAHLDTVFDQPRYVQNDDGVLSGKFGLGADDRAGVYGIIHLLNMGFRPTVIFLEDEEIGGVGAKKFVADYTELNVNYLIELDRQGATDAVFYDCGNTEFEDYVCDFGFKTAYGSFSDISILGPHFDLGAVNLSIGYFGQHTTREMLFIDLMMATIEKVSKMLSDNNEIRFDCQEIQWGTYYKSYATGITFTKKRSKYASSFYDEYEDLEYYYDREVTEAEELESKYDDVPWEEDRLDATEVIALMDCIVNLPDGTLIDTNYYPDYYLDKHNNIIHLENGYLKDAVLLDYSWNVLTYDKIVSTITWRQYKGGWDSEDYS